MNSPRTTYINAIIGRSAQPGIPLGEAAARGLRSLTNAPEHTQLLGNTVLTNVHTERIYSLCPRNLSCFASIRATWSSGKRGPENLASRSRSGYGGGAMKRYRRWNPAKADPTGTMRGDGLEELNRRTMELIHAHALKVNQRLSPRLAILPNQTGAPVSAEPALPSARSTACER